MDENPYRPPENYSVQRKTVPIGAYVVVTGLLMAGVALIIYGFINLLPSTTLAGFFWTGLALTGLYFIIKHRRAA
jgi:hypothetical protein